MNNNIQESYCSSEVSLLLNEKGCDVPSPYWNFEEIGKLSVRKLTHALAIEWIRVNFDINIFIIRDGGYWIGKFQDFSEENQQSPKEVIVVCKDTPQEATEAALLYTLQNLIK